MKKNILQKHNKSVAFRLSIKFSLIVAVIILLSSTAFVFLLRKNIRKQQNMQLIDAANQIEIRLINPPDFPSPPKHQEPIQDSQNHGQFKNPPTPPPYLKFDIPYYISFGIFRTTNTDSGINPLATNDPFLPQLEPTNGKVLHYYDKEYFIDGALNILYFTREVSTKQFGKVIIQTALSMDQDSSRFFVSETLMLSIILFIPLVLLSFCLVYLITNRTMYPVKKITQTAKKISSANLLEQLPVSGNGDEIDELAQTFNDLFERLKNDFDREKQFTSDVSHELKTPLAVILGHANLLMRWGKDDPVQLEKSLSMLINEIHSMRAIVENLLQLSRLDSGRLRIKTQKVSLLPLCHRLEADTKVWSPNTDFVLDKSLKGLSANINRELFYQACTIIISNSVKFYAEKKSTEKDNNLHIKLSARFDEENKHGSMKMLDDKTRLENQQEYILFSIEDNGPGISKKVLPHIFERFYRGDSSHNNSAGGSGLGLSIVKSIMNSLHGSAFAQSDGVNGTTITLLIPTDYYQSRS